jgi:hypothetical protein
MKKTVIVHIWFWSVLLGFTGWVGASHAQSRIDTVAIIHQLERIRQRDQKPRKNTVKASEIRRDDSLNLKEIEDLISKYGWPGIEFVGGWGNNTVFLVIQHADLPVQKKYMPLFLKSVIDHQSRPCDLALMQDRILMREGKPQIYGSQLQRNPKTGQYEFYQIDNEKIVNERRTSVGLEPIEKYAKSFGIEYKPAVTTSGK